MIYWTTWIWLVLLAAMHVHAETDRPAQVVVQHLSTFGRKGQGRGEFFEPSGIAVDAVGNLYVADTGNDRIQKFGPKGTYLSETGGFGWAEGQFNRPSGVAAGRGLDIFVADSRNNRVQICSQNLQPVAVVGGRDADGPIALGTLAGIAVSEVGEIYVTDTDIEQVVQITNYSRTDRSFGGYGYGTGRLRRPLGLTVGTTGDVYVCDAENGRIAVFDRFGNFRKAMGADVLDEPAGVCMGPKGTLFVADAGYHRVVVFDLKDGEVAGQIGGPDAGREAGSFKGPRGLVVDTAGMLYVLDTGNSRVQKFRVYAFRR